MSALRIVLAGSLAALLMHLSVSCGDTSRPYGGSVPGGAQAGVPAAVSDAQGHFAGRAHVLCGCAIPSVGICGEYIEMNGEMTPLELPADNDLGPMPFCGQDGLVADVRGNTIEGKFVAKSFELATKPENH